MMKHLTITALEWKCSGKTIAISNTAKLWKVQQDLQCYFKPDCSGYYIKVISKCECSSNGGAAYMDALGHCVLANCVS